MPELHRMYFHFSELPLSMRALFTCALIVLGTGYLFAMIYIYLNNEGRDGIAGLSQEDLVIAYSGSKSDTRLEGALKASMSSMLPNEEKNIIVNWVRRGTEKAEFEAQVQPVFEKRCLACHDGSNPHIPNLITYEDAIHVAALDTGMTIPTLVRVSHIHLFGITFIFFVLGFIFSHAFVRPRWLKSLVVVLPFCAVFLDIGSWYLTKIHPGFAWVVMIGGGLMGMSFAFMWVVSFYQIWFYKLPANVTRPDANPYVAR